MRMRRSTAGHLNVDSAKRVSFALHVGATPQYVTSLIKNFRARLAAQRCARHNDGRHITAGRVARPRGPRSKDHRTTSGDSPVQWPRTHAPRAAGAACYRVVSSPTSVPSHSGVTRPGSASTLTPLGTRTITPSSPFSALPTRTTAGTSRARARTGRPEPRFASLCSRRRPKHSRCASMACSRQMREQTSRSPSTEPTPCALPQLSSVSSPPRVPRRSPRRVRARGCGRADGH